MASPPAGTGEYAQAWIDTTIVSGPVVELPPIRLARIGVKHGETVGDLGLTIKQPEPGADPLQRRLIVAVARPGSPAAAAGILVGDEIVPVGGHDVTGANAYLYRSLTMVALGRLYSLGSHAAQRSR